MRNSLYKSRLKRLCKTLAVRDHKFFLVTGLPNIRYLTGFEGSNGILLIAPDGPVLYTDGRYSIQARQQTSCGDIKVLNTTFFPGVVEEIKRYGMLRLAFENNRLSFYEYEHLCQKFTKCQLYPLDQLVELQRAVKSRDEVDKIGKSTILNSLAFEKVCNRVVPEWTELRMAAEIEYEMCFLGATGKAFDTIVASGVRSALPHATPGQSLLLRNSPIVVDHGAILDGYASDMTRVICFGRPDDSFCELHEAVKEAQVAATAAVKAGVKASTVDRVARRVLGEYRLEEAFTHSTGHGIGLEIHELPRINSAGDVRLVSGMVITIEPGVYIEGVGGVRIEDVVVVTPTGCQILTRTSRELRVL